jgi:hypothetical protein
MTATDALSTIVLEDIAFTFRKQQELADRALAQVDDADFFRTLDAESNSVAILVKHIGGNLRSRWTDFLSTDGEKPDRDRDGEFIVPGETAVPMSWQRGTPAGARCSRRCRPCSLPI